MTVLSKIEPRSDTFVRNAEHYAGLLATLHERMAWAVRSCSVASRPA